MKKQVIWDLSGTLFRPSSDDMSPDQIQDYSFVFLMWSGKKEASRLDKIAFDLLGKLGQQPESDEKEIIRVHTGVPLPLILCDYLAGRINSTEATEKTLAYFDIWAPQHLTEEDQSILKRMLTTFFDPESLARCMKPIGPSVELAKKTAQKSPLYILSNWDHDSFIPFYSKYKDSALSEFKRNNIVISADTGFVKPQRGIFEYLIKHTGLNPAECLFIDDQQENVKASNAFGIEALRFQESQVHELEERLKKMDLI